MKKLQTITLIAAGCFILSIMTTRCYAKQTNNNTKNKNTVTIDTIKAYANVNGLKMYYEMQGTGKPVIILHGGFGNTELFMPNLTALPKNYKLIYVDLQGHGRTTDIDRPIDPSIMANDIAELIKQLGLGKTNVIGYSLGGMVALRLTIQHPELVEKAVIISCPFKRTGWFPDLLVQQDQMGVGAAEALKQSPLYESYKKIAPKPEDWEKFVGKMSTAIKKDYDWSKEVAAIKLPVLLIAADADGLMPQHIIEFYRLLGGGLKDAGWDGSGRPVSQLAIIPGQTHYDLFASPVLAAVIEPFFDKK